MLVFLCIMLILLMLVGVGAVILYRTLTPPSGVRYVLIKTSSYEWAIYDQSVVPPVRVPGVNGKNGYGHDTFSTWSQAKWVVDLMNQKDREEKGR
jgi:hypothetical protein